MDYQNQLNTGYFSKREWNNSLNFGSVELCRSSLPEAGGLCSDASVKETVYSEYCKLEFTGFYLLLKLVLMWEMLNVTCDDRALTVLWTFGLGCLFESSITKDNRSTKGIQGNLTVFLEIDPVISQCKNFYWGHQPKLSNPITGNEFHLNSLPFLLPNCQGIWNYLEGKPEAGFSIFLFSILRKVPIHSLISCQQNRQGYLQ